MAAAPSSTPSTLRRRLRLVGRSVRRFRPDLSWLVGAVRSFAVSFIALAVTIQLLPGTQVTRGTVTVATLAVAVLALGAVLRPLLTRLTVVTGIAGLLVAGLITQVLVLGLALQLVPTVRPFSLSEIFVASWGAAVVAAAVNWLFDTSSDEAFLGQVLGQSVRLTHRVGTETPGLLVVQLDGVSRPLLRQAITGGSMPTIARWLRGGTHDLRGWHTGVPATTPAGQAALLHGDTRAVPAFRWYDKEAGRLVVTSQPDDVALVERGLSDGRGLLADGGVSVSNLFSGDAPTRILTMSDARIPSGERGVALFAVNRGGFVRSAVLMVGQMITEWFQGRRQRRRDVVPRVRRTGVFVLLRGVTTVVLRDLSVSVVAEHMARSAPAIYVDFVDYDEVAHHAGPSRPESIRQLENLDRVLGFFEELAEEVRADYEIVVVSDHGQSQGMTFKQLAGCTLSDVVHDLAAQTVVTADDDRPVEHWGPANVLAAGARGGPVVDALSRRASRKQRPDADPPSAQDLVVAASGSLAHVYLPQHPGRLTLEEIEAIHPRLVAGLTAHPQVGAVMVRTAAGGVRVLGADGWSELDGDGAAVVEGVDPLAPYGRHAAADLAQLDTRQHVGDLVVIGRIDLVLGEVVAFEELVGSHGGLGGWQTDALLVHPRSWSVPEHELGGVDVHRTLVARLEELGLRSDA